MTLGALTFLSPWLLTALAALPLIYWLLRTVPPRPQQINFPATRILVGIENREKTPAKTPWWLLLIRLLAAALIIFALADPILNPSRDQALKGRGPIAIIIDNGWASAPQWSQRQNAVEQYIAYAEAASRPVIIVPTAHAAKSVTFKIEAPNDARATAAAMKPQPFNPTRLASVKALSEALTAASATSASIVWLTDNIAHTDEAEKVGEALADLAKGGSLAVITDPAGEEPLAVAATVGAAGKLRANIMRTSGGTLNGTLFALSARNERLGEATFNFGEGTRRTETEFELPLELRNQVARVVLAGTRSAGAVSLLDASSQWNRIGLLSGESSEQSQPLLGPLYYIEKALAPYAELVTPKDANLAAGVEQVLEQKSSILVLADIGTLTGEVGDQVSDWVGKGGILVRFAGPRLEKGGDGLLPAPLRIGGRSLGGALSWSTPQKLAQFDEKSLFVGLKVSDEVLVNQQVLADPTRMGADVEVWARLEDGTPLVTAISEGSGKIVLFHVTANSDWSNLPLSGLFVDMLRRIATLGNSGGGVQSSDLSSAGAARNTTADSAPDALSPIQILNGFGELTAPPPTAQAVAASKFTDLKPSLNHPPGYYGAGARPRALNIATTKTDLKPLPPLPASAEQRGYQKAQSTPLKPWLLAAALTLIFLDVLAILLLQSGGLRMRRTPPQTASLALVALAASLIGAVTPTVPANAQETPPAADAKSMRATSGVTLGYVITGDPETDNTSEIGLSGLGRVLTLRTSVTPGKPIGVDITKDEIAFYPVLYWPVLKDAPDLPEPIVAKIDAYMKQGGLIIFDTRDHGLGGTTGAPLPGTASAALQRIVKRIDIPRLEPVPEGHVVTKSFYLLRSFPGRWAGGRLWVEAGATDNTGSERRARRSDGVTSIMITSNDFAAAWAIDKRGRPFFRTVPRGELQREMAFRTGINIVMHALTGNYKADQVHVPALLQRLGQ